MKESEGPSAVTLQARFPTSETISIEAEASEEMKKVKERIASMGGLDVDSFTLTFDGEVVATADDDGGGKLVGDLPFEDGSMLEVVVCKKQAALLKLSKMGISVKGRGDDLFAILDSELPRCRNTTFLGPLEEETDCLNSTVDENVGHIVSLLLDAGVSGREEEALHMAVRHSLPSCIEVLLIRTSVNVNSEVSRRLMDVRCTALHHATVEEVAAVLLKHNADVNAKDGHGTPVLHGAVNAILRRGILPVLLKHDADVDARDRNGRTALHGRYVDSSMVRLLLEHKADIEAQDDEGATPLFTNITGVEALLEHGADVNARDNKGNTCLHHTVRKGQVWVLPVLLRHNADVTAANDEGKTALDLVRSSDRYFSAMRSLLQDPGLAQDLELFERGELSDVSRLPVVEMIWGCITGSLEQW